ncbi:hypothetical protein B4U80_11297 [Leptotrombidium deliense]|uniref:Histamine H1 receptor n=1 Tax=Leptotrombidium deliense TaxID=299467 RepID=A0A443S3K7_9ACAR|nr:hypothetical protein B4U80_11297 [Leptotrombidium deliense]
MFILSLASADLIVGLTVMPISSVYVLTGDWIFGVIVCQIWLVIDYTASTASIFNLLILSLDRYWSIRSPLKYLCKRTKKRALGMIIIVWILSASWMIPIVAWHQWNNHGIRKQPNNVCETEFNDNVLFKLTTSSVNFFIPMTLMIVLYFKIYREIKRRGEIDIGRCSLSIQYNGKNKSVKHDENNDDDDECSPECLSTDSTVKHYQKLTIIKSDNSNSFAFENYKDIQVKSSRLRQEKKAARQLGVILGAFLACWLPYVIVFIVTAYCSCISQMIHTFVTWLGYFNSTINPFLYALCNDNFKNAFRKLLARQNQHQQNTFETVTHGTSFRVSRTHENQYFS